jgi:CubicO group peptidase (beta-lactamase class C family)
VSPLDQVDDWPVRSASVVVLDAGGDVVDARRAGEVSYEWASLTKVVTALACWVAVEEGTLAWDRPAGPEGSTVAHLLAHASGLAPDGPDVLAAPGTRRIYSNRGFEVLAEVLGEAAGMAPTDYLVEGVTGPLGMARTVPVAGPTGTVGPIDDLVALGRCGPRSSRRRRWPVRPRSPSPASTACCPASAARRRTTGDWASSCAAPNGPTGRRRTARLARSGTSAARVASSGSTPMPAWPVAASRTGRSATGP